MVILAGHWLAGSREMAQMAASGAIVSRLIGSAPRNAVAAPALRLHLASLRRSRFSRGRQVDG